MITKFKLWEGNSGGKPDLKYPVDKCLDFYTVRQELERLHGIDLYEIPCGTGGKYKTADFYSWAGENFDPIFPKPSMTDVYHEREKKKYARVGMDATKYRYFERDSIYELPEHYDPKEDVEEWYLKKAKFKGDMEQMTGKPWDDKNDQHINFGPQSNEWVNIALHKIHELYPQYYKNGTIKIWNGDDEFERGKEIYDYPLDKAYFLSDIENWLSDTFEVNTDEFCEWVLRSNFIEGRWWMRTWQYDIEEQNFRKEKAPKNIQTINDILRQIFKTEQIEIYFDYYKNINDKDIYD